ncbi:unnamed protein product [Mytilus edulis]|uniref:Uncharacterized protein n=1 Tax=Mytilus edulis TaxID=6550 RepID=A0A8S3S266_MYTED|nr:unnamed protein product [Mytilus edulis]
MNSVSMDVVLSYWLTLLSSFLIFVAQGSEASRWISRNINDYRRPPFRQPPPLDIHPDYGPDYGQTYRQDPSFAPRYNMIPTTPPSFYEFFDPISGVHKKIINHFDHQRPTYRPYPQDYTRSLRLRDASPFPSTYEKKQFQNTYNAPHENSYANDKQFYSDFATRRHKSFMNNAQFSGQLKGNGINDDFVIYLMGDWKGYRG